MCNFGNKLLLRRNAAFWHARGMEKKLVRVQLVIAPSELEALDAWRAKERIWSRSEAIRQLIAAGIKDDPKAGVSSPK